MTDYIVRYHGPEGLVHTQVVQAKGVLTALFEVKTQRYNSVLLDVWGVLHATGQEDGLEYRVEPVR